MKGHSRAHQDGWRGEASWHPFDGGDGDVDVGVDVGVDADVDVEVEVESEGEVSRC